MGLIFGIYYINILVAIICVILAYYRYTLNYFKRRGIPYEQPIFIFGNAKNMILQKESFGHMVKNLYENAKSKGHRFSGYFILSVPQIILIDPELIKSVMQRDFPYFHARATQGNVEKEPITGHLISLSGTKWKNMRTKLTPTFTSGKMRMMFQTIMVCADGLENILDEYVENKEGMDIKDVLGRFTTDIIGSCAFGLDCNSIKDSDSDFRKFGRKIFTGTLFKSMKQIISRLSPRLFQILNLRQVDKDITDFFTKVISESIEYREKNNIKRNDFLQLLINIKNTGDVDGESGNHADGLTLNEITAQSFIFFLAGFETSSTTMTFFLYDMVQHQDIQDKVRKEINDVLKKYDGKVTYEGVMELQYLEMVLFESMRLHAAIPIIQRKCTKDYKIPDTDITIEKGVTVSIPVYGLQSDPDYYPEPEKFDPQRFSPEEKEKRHPFTFLPFGEGPRVCIGLRFGLLQTKVGLVTLLKNHRFTLNEKTKVPLVIDPRSLIFNVEGGVWLNAERI